MRVKTGRGNYAMKEDPTQRVERPTCVQPERRYLHKDELRAFMTVECEPYEALVRDVLFGTALRAAELAALSVGDVHEDSAGRVIITVTVKGNKRNEIPLPVEIGERVKAAIARRRGEQRQRREPLLLNRDGGRFTRHTISKLTRKLGRKAGIERMPTGAHSFRHTLNALGDAAGLTVVERAAMLNHSGTSAIARYDHLLPGRSADARERLWQTVKEVTGT